MTDLIADYRAMVAGHTLATTDPLGLGGLLMDASRVAQLAAVDGDLLDLLLESALQGLPIYAQARDLHDAAARRLAFRELGLSIGLHALALVRQSVERRGTTARTKAVVEALARFAPLARVIEGFWLDRGHRETASYVDHRDINDVMLATSLAPNGFIVLPPVGRDSAPGFVSE